MMYLKELHGPVCVPEKKIFDSSKNGKGKVISIIVAEDVMLREERSFTNGRSEVIYIIKYMKHFHEITV